MKNRSGLERTPPAKEKSSPKGRGSSSKEQSPSSVVAETATAASAVSVVLKKSGKTSETAKSGEKVSNLSALGVAQEPALPAVLVSEAPSVDPRLEAEYNELTKSSPTAKESIMIIIDAMPPDFNIFHPKDTVSFVRYGQFVFFHHVAMKVLRVCILWYEHEKYNDTEANWSHERIQFNVMANHGEMMACDCILNQSVTFLSIGDVQRPLLEYPAITKKPAVGSSVVTVSNASLKDVSPSKMDGSISSLRSNLMAEHNLQTPPSRR